MHFLVSSLFALSLVSGALAKKPVAFSSRVIYTPSANYTDPRVLYARSVQLPNGDLLATWENYSPEPPLVYFPIWKSTDNAQSWKELSRVQDTANKLGLRYQPDLYVLPERIGQFPKGTLLLSGSSIPTDLSTTQIELYASRDSGRTWQFVSHIAAGGRAVPNNGETPVWEPFLMALKGKLIVYYSDQRDPAHGQKMVHQTSSDLKTWSPVADDTAYETYTDRPGMPTVAKLPNGEYVYAYEYGSFFNTTSYSFPVYYRISRDPLKFNDAPHHQLIATSGAKPTSSPYIVWTPWGGKNGTLIASANSHTSVFINQALGQGLWREVPTSEPRSYTRSLRVLEGDSKKILIIGGGKLPPSSTNQVTNTVLDLEVALKFT